MSNKIDMRIWSEEVGKPYYIEKKKKKGMILESLILGLYKILSQLSFRNSLSKSFFPFSIPHSFFSYSFILLYLCFA
jgi:hypothetical protein